MSLIRERRYDDVLEEIGPFGRYQRRMLLLISVPVIPIAMQALMTVYILATPDHRCALPGDSSDTYAIADQFHANKINSTIPPGDGVAYDRCRLYTFANESDAGANRSESFPENRTLSHCSRWVYDMTNFHSTLVTELSFVCENSIKKSHAQMFYMLGSLVGTFIFGPLGDIIGRKKIVIISLLIFNAASNAIAFARSFPFLCFFLMVDGAACTAFYNVLYVIGLELVAPKKRTLAGSVIIIFFGIGVILLPTLAYFIRDWDKLVLTISSWVVVFVVYYWLLPESPRWLLSKLKFSEASEILLHAAKVNEAPTPAPWSWDRRAQSAESLWHILNHRVLFIRTVIIYLNWMVCNMNYYGLSLNVAYLSGNIFVNSVLFGVVETASYVLSMVLLDRIGRKWLHLAFMSITGICCTLSSLPKVYGGNDYLWVATVLATIGKFGASGAYANIWLFSAELFPTVLRSSGLSSGSFFARMGGLISPYIANLGSQDDVVVVQILPLMIFGALSLIAGALAYLLPETKNARLPETIAEAIRFGSSNANRKGLPANSIVPEPEANQIDSDPESKFSDLYPEPAIVAPNTSFSGGRTQIGVARPPVVT